MPEQVKNSGIPEYKVVGGKIGGVLSIERASSVDERGFFRESWRKSLLTSLGIDFGPIQMNHSMSETGVIRGIHAEKWDKLVYPITGKMWVPIVDLRPESETFGQYEEYTFDCTGDNTPNRVLFLPSGIGNSICAVEGPVHYIYLVSAYWTPDSSFAINPFDKDLNISWPVENPILKDSDLQAPSLRERFPEKFR
jgi:dTDP-4-dehydrorhamnose 3,5-epimerase